MTDEALNTAAEDLVARLTRLGPDVRVARRLIAAGTSQPTKETDMLIHSRIRAIADRQARRGQP